MNLLLIQRGILTRALKDSLGNRLMISMLEMFPAQMCIRDSSEHLLNCMCVTRVSCVSEAGIDKKLYRFSYT